MIPVTVYVPENRLAFFNELLENLHFELDTTNIPDWHKTIIDQRLKEYELNPADAMQWDEVKHTFKLK